MEQKSGGAFQWPSFGHAAKDGGKYNNAGAVIEILRVYSQGCEECRKCLERFSTNGRKAALRQQRPFHL